MRFTTFFSLLIGFACLVGCAAEGQKSNKNQNQDKYAVISSGFENMFGAFADANELDLDKHVQGKIMVGDKKATVDDVAASAPYYSEEGLASWYGPRFHGRKTANGSIYDQHEFTAAHRELPLPSVGRVTNLETNRSILVVFTDRGPYARNRNRIIDLSKKAASELGIVHKGIAKVRVEYLHDETMRLLSKFPQDKQSRSRPEISKVLIKHVTHLNMKNGADS